MTVRLFMLPTPHCCPRLAGMPLHETRMCARRLMGSWYALLLLATVASLPRQQWDRAVVRTGVGSVLLALAAWQLGSVSAKSVERAVRYGLAVTLDRALRGAVDYEVRWLAKRQRASSRVESSRENV